MISAILLAAGRSTRMGTLKLTEKIGESTVIERTLASLRKAGIADIVVVLGYKADEINAALDVANIQTVRNPSYAEGISSSIKVGLSNLSPDSDAALIMLGDQPFVMPRTIKRIIQERKISGARMVVPTYKGMRGNPVLVDRSMFKELRKLSGDVGARKLIDEGIREVRFLVVHDPGVALDIDTKSDLKKARKSKPYFSRR
jgi:molybdenum cofactor cytidylyltransferase